MFRDRPALVAEVLADQFGIAVPSFDRVRISSADLADAVPTEYRADTVVVLCRGEKSVLAALNSMDHEHARLYADVVLSALPAAARKSLEALMMLKYEYQSDFARTYYSQGEAKGEAKAVLLVLEARGIAVPDDVRETVARCTDLGQLDLWIRRAATVRSAQELLA